MAEAKLKHPSHAIYLPSADELVTSFQLWNNNGERGNGSGGGDLLKRAGTAWDRPPASASSRENQSGDGNKHITFPLTLQRHVNQRLEEKASAEETAGETWRTRTRRLSGNTVSVVNLSAWGWSWVLTDEQLMRISAAPLAGP